MSENCAVFKTAELIGKKWILLILFELYKGKKIKRHADIKKALPSITPKMLSQRLKELEQHKLIKKSINTDEFPVKTYYSLTKSGEDFFKVINEIKKWSLNREANVNHCKKIPCKHCKK